MKHIQSSIDGTHHRQPEHLHFQSTCSAHGRLEQSAKSIRFITSTVDKHISVKEMLATLYRQNIVQKCVNPCGRKLRKWKMKSLPFPRSSGSAWTTTARPMMESLPVRGICQENNRGMWGSMSFDNNILKSLSYDENMLRTLRKIRLTHHC